MSPEDCQNQFQRNKVTQREESRIDLFCDRMNTTVPPTRAPKTKGHLKNKSAKVLSSVSVQLNWTQEKE